GDCLVVVFLARVGLSAVQESNRMITLKGNCPCIIGDGPVNITSFDISISSIVVAGRVWLYFDDDVEVSDRSIIVSALCIGCRTMPVEVEICWLECNGMAEIRDGLLML